MEDIYLLFPIKKILFSHKNNALQIEYHLFHFFTGSSYKSQLFTKLFNNTPIFLSEKPFSPLKIFKGKLR